MSAHHFLSRSVIITCAWVSLAGMGHVPVHAEEEMTEDTYHYNPTGKRDPFRSPFLLVLEQETPETVKTPLQRFDLEQLKLVGIILKANEYRALIEDSEGLGYIVTKGTPIGLKGGVIKAIESKRVVVEEYETDFYGNRRVQKRELQLVAETPQRRAKTGVK